MSRAIGHMSSINQSRLPDYYHNYYRNPHLLVGIFTLGFLLLTGCGEFTPSENEPKTATSKHVNSSNHPPTANFPTYSLEVDSAYPPYDIANEGGAPTGFDVDILNAIAADRKFHLEITSTKWKDLLIDIDNGKYDLVVGGFSSLNFSDESKEHYVFSNPYIYTQDAIGIIDQDIEVSTFDDLKPYKVSTMAETSWVDDLEALQDSSSNIVPTDTSFLAVQKVIQKEADATINDRGVLLHYQSTIPEINMKVVGEGNYFKSYALIILVKKDINGLDEKINEGLFNIVANGTYAKIYKKWFGINPERLPVTSIKQDLN